ncbi:MAG TPA: hypothetical protein VGF17_25735 [Phytomonospora sp.]
MDDGFIEDHLAADPRLAGVGCLVLAAIALAAAFWPNAFWLGPGQRMPVRIGGTVFAVVALGWAVHLIFGAG